MSIQSPVVLSVLVEHPNTEAPRVSIIFGYENSPYPIIKPQITWISNKVEAETTEARKEL